MIQQVEITLKPKSRGFHLVNSEIMSQLPILPKTGIMNIFCKHTSCGLSINENADRDVRVDMETIFNRLVPENRPEYEHTLEGADDMPAHAKSTLSGVSLTILITNGRLNMGNRLAASLVEEPGKASTSVTICRRRTTSTNEAKETKDQIFCYILYLLVCRFSLSG